MLIQSNQVLLLLLVPSAVPRLRQFPLVDKVSTVSGSAIEQFVDQTVGPHSSHGGGCCAFRQLAVEQAWAAMALLGTEPRNRVAVYFSVGVDVEATVSPGGPFHWWGRDHGFELVHRLEFIDLEEVWVVAGSSISSVAERESSCVRSGNGVDAVSG